MIGFIAGVILSQSWWRAIAVAAVASSGILYLHLGKGRLQRLDGHGGVGQLIGLATLLAVLVVG